MSTTYSLQKTPEFFVDHRNKNDLLRLASELKDLSHMRARDLWVKLVVAKLMHLPLIIRLALTLATLVAAVRRNPVTKEMLLLQMISDPRLDAFFDDVWDQTVDWMVNGKDRFDASSAGGWSNQEMRIFLNIYRPIRQGAHCSAVQ